MTTTAVTAAGPTEVSNAPSVSVPPRPPPPVVGKVTHHSIELYWEEAMQRLAEVSQKSDGRIRAVLQEKADVGGRDWGNVYSGFGKRHIIDGLEPEHRFSYRLSFKNNHGASEWSQPVVVSTTKEPLTGEHLHKAIRRNDPIELRNILAKGEANIEATDATGFTPLMAAAQKGYVELVELLLARGADVNAQTEAQKTPLMLASFAGQLDTVKLLLARGADLHAKDKTGGTALHAAVDGQALETVRELLEMGSDVNRPDRGSLWTPLLRCAATHGNADVARLLLKKGGNVNQKDRDGKTALMIACIGGHAPLVDLLLECSADLNIKSEFGKTAYDFAVSMERRRIAKSIEDFMRRKGLALPAGAAASS